MLSSPVIVRSNVPDSLARVAEPLSVPAPAADDPLAWLTGLEGVPSGLAAARGGVDALLRDRGRKQTTPEQTAESLLRGAHATAVLEGSTSTIEQLRAGDADEIAQAALRVSTGMLALVP